MADDKAPKQLPLDSLSQAVRPFEVMYDRIPEGLTPEQWHERLGGTAQSMVQRGTPKELDFILEKFPETAADLIQSNPDAQALFDELRSSPRYLSWALSML